VHDVHIYTIHPLKCFTLCVWHHTAGPHGLLQHHWTDIGVNAHYVTRKQTHNAAAVFLNQLCLPMQQPSRPPAVAAAGSVPQHYKVPSLECRYCDALQCHCFSAHTCSNTVGTPYRLPAVMAAPEGCTVQLTHLVNASEANLLHTASTLHRPTRASPLQIHPVTVQVTTDKRLAVLAKLSTNQKHLRCCCIMHVLSKGIVS
jgi:hypothetical protein